MTKPDQAIRTCIDFRVENLPESPSWIKVPNETIIGQLGHWGGIKPNSYHLNLIFSNRTHHNGSIVIKFSVLKATDKIFINQDASSLEIDFSRITLKPKCVNESEDSATHRCIEKVIHVSKEQTSIIFLENYQLHVNCTYTLSIPEFHPTQARYAIMQSAKFGLLDWVNHDGNSASLTTVFQMRHARTAFPCLDNMALKAIFQLCIEHPIYLMAASNTVIDRNRSHAVDSQRTLGCFEPTPPLPTYIFTISLMENYTSEKIGMPGQNFELEMFAPVGDVAYFASFLNLSISAISFVTKATNFKFPLKRFGFVITQPGKFAGLEHMGLISLDYYEMQKTISREVLLIHEIVHQWIGNAVTVGDWRHICLQEGLTSYFEWYLSDRFDVWPLDRRLETQDELTVEYEAYALQDHEDVAGRCFETVPAFFHTITKISGGFEIMERFLARLIEKRPYGTADIEVWDATMGEVSGGRLRGYIKSWFLSPGPLYLLISNENASITVRQRILRNGTLIEPSSPHVVPVDLQAVPSLKLEKSILNQINQSIPVDENRSIVIDPNRNTLAIKVYSAADYLLFLGNHTILDEKRIKEIVEDFCTALINDVFPIEESGRFNATKWVELLSVATQRYLNAECLFCVENDQCPKNLTIHSMLGQTGLTEI